MSTFTKNIIKGNQSLGILVELSTLGTNGHVTYRSETRPFSSISELSKIILATEKFALDTVTERHESELKFRAVLEALGYVENFNIEEA